MDSDWIAEQTHTIESPDRRDLPDGIVKEFGQIRATLVGLPKATIHNDVSDYNVLVHGSLSELPYVTGVIDFVDMCAATRVCELAMRGLIWFWITVIQNRCWQQWWQLTMRSIH